MDENKNELQQPENQIQADNPIQANNQIPQNDPVQAGNQIPQNDPVQAGNQISQNNQPQASFEAESGSMVRKFEDLDSSERSALKKQYFSKVNPTDGKLRILSMAILVPAVVLLCIVVFYAIKSLVGDEQIFWQWYLGFVIMPLCAIAMGIAAIFTEGLERWLFKEHRILMAVRFKDKEAILECERTTQTKSYKSLDRKQKMELFKEFAKRDSSTKFNFALAIVSIAVLVFLIATLIINAIRIVDNYTPLLSSIFGLISFVFVIYIILYQANYRQFIGWLEYHKNIIKTKK